MELHESEKPTNCLMQSAWNSGRRAIESVLCLMVLGLPAAAQTNPAPQPIPYHQDFGNNTFSSPPVGMAAWGGLNGGSINSVNAAGSSAPTADAAIAAATTSQTAGGCFGLASSSNARFYVQTSSNATNGTNQLALALDTRGLTGITLTYEVEVVHAQPRTVGIVCQCRSGTSGSWTTLSPAQGLNPFSQSGGTPGLKTTVQAVLPTLADDQPVVQIRWAIWRGTETGNSSGVAIDNITASATDDEDPYSPPAGYYSPASGLTGSALKSALKTIVAAGHVAIPYGDTLAPLRVLDADPSNSANVLTVYSGVSVPRNDVYRPNVGLDSDRYWSREHVWPASFGLDPEGVSPGSTGGNAGPDYPDLHNLRPELQTINFVRGNLYFDETSGTPQVPALAPLCSSDSDSWEPPDALKGDLARIALYMATRYNGAEPLTSDLEIGQTPSTTASRFAKLTTLLLWTEADPVSQAERRRNHLVQGYQGNRNPFVDHPEFVAQIWGGIRLSQSALSVSEGGATGTYSLVLTTQPTNDVTIVIQQDSSERVSATPGTLQFTSSNWSTPQTVTIAAVDDAVYWPPGTASLSHAVTSGDPRYSGFAISPVSIDVTDNDPLIAPTSLPIAFGGPWSPLPVGYLGTGIGTYSTSLGGDGLPGSCKFDDTGDRLVVSFTAAPGLLGYQLKGQPGSGTLTTGTMAVEESADGLTWTTVRTITNKSNADETYTDSLKSGSRFVAFSYQSKISGNLQLDALTINAAITGGWQTWLATNQLTGADAEGSADNDLDDLPNLVEYLLGGNPKGDSSALRPQCSISGANLVMTFTRTDAAEIDTTHSVEWTEDFSTWTSIPVGAATGGSVVVDERGGDPDRINVFLPLAAGNPGRIFVRLKVVKP